MTHEPPTARPMALAAENPGMTPDHGHSFCTRTRTLFVEAFGPTTAHADEGGIVYQQMLSRGGSVHGYVYVVVRCPEAGDHAHILISDFCLTAGDPVTAMIVGTEAELAVAIERIRARWKAPGCGDGPPCSKHEASKG